MQLDAENENYFASYGSLQTHELMLLDEPRTTAYCKAIQQFCHLFENKIIVDVGCGTGILSLFAAKYGKAKKVYAIEANPHLAQLARKIIERNGYSQTIQVLEGMVEDLITSTPSAIPHHSVDGIISEWMGFYLLHESMLDSVLFARDLLLRKDSKEVFLFPMEASIYASPCDLTQFFAQKYSKWNSFYSFDFSDFAHAYKNQLFFEEEEKQYILETLNHIPTQETFLSSPQQIQHLNLMTITPQQLRCLQHFSTFTVSKRIKEEEDSSIQMHGIAIWFTVAFFDPLQGPNANAIVLDTSPMASATHWKQTIVLFPNGQSFEMNVGEEIPLSIVMESNDEFGDTKRHYTISLEFGEPSEMIE